MWKVTLKGILSHKVRFVLTGVAIILGVAFICGTLVFTATINKAFDEVVDAVGLRDRLSHRPTELSGGQQQRVAVARALVSRPDLMFADEPTGNLDSKSGAEILTFMRDAVTSLHQTIVMVTHDPVAASYASRVVFLADGRIVDEQADPTVESVMQRLGEQ